MCKGLSEMFSYIHRVFQIDYKYFEVYFSDSFNYIIAEYWLLGNRFGIFKFIQINIYISYYSITHNNSHQNAKFDFHD